jgi:hypothetical protein
MLRVPVSSLSGNQASETLSLISVQKCDVRHKFETTTHERGFLAACWLHGGMQTHRFTPCRNTYEKSPATFRRRGFADFQLQLDDGFVRY